MSYAALGVLDKGCYPPCSAASRGTGTRVPCIDLCRKGPLTASADPECYRTCPQGSFEEYAECARMCRDLNGGVASRRNLLLLGGGVAVAGLAAFLLLRRKKR